VALKFSSLENIWLLFWRSTKINQNTNFYEEQLSNNKFFNLCEINQIIEFVKQCDYQFYQFCIEILIPNVLGPLPHNLVQNIRTLAKNVDTWLKNALINAPEKIKQVKILVISTFSMTLRRYTSLNHLVQTVRNSLQNESILIQMLNDISKVDFVYIREQAKWACECDDSMILKFENEFKESLKNHNSWNLDKWMTWLEDDVANYYLKQYEGTKFYGKMAKKFLLKWSFLW
jgi:regulatory factor X 1/2/3